MTEKSIRDQLWDAADPTGSQRTLLEAAALVGRTPAWLQPRVCSFALVRDVASEDGGDEGALVSVEVGWEGLGGAVDRDGR